MPLRNMSCQLRAIYCFLIKQYRFCNCDLPGESRQLQGFKSQIQIQVTSQLQPVATRRAALLDDSDIS